MKNLLIMLMGFGLISYLSAQVYINEVDYDQPGGDTMEFIELIGPSGGSLDGYVIELINGNNGSPYTPSPIDLNGLTIPADNINGFGFFVVGASAVANVDLTPGSFTIQNGAPDGILLKLNGVVVDGFSYEGAITNNGDFTAGMALTAEDVGDNSIGRVLFGFDAADQDQFFAQDVFAPSPGGVNADHGQTLSGDPLPAISNISRDQRIPSPGVDLSISADVTDNSGLTAVELRWSIDGGATQSVAMTSGTADAWTGSIPGSGYVDGAAVEYWIWAEDDNAQTSESPRIAVFVGDTPIANLRVNDAAGVPLYRGADARVTGVATVGTSTFSISHLDVFIQDATSGINIFKFSSNDSINILPGNSYTVVGPLDHFRGKTEIIPERIADITDNGPDVLPAAEVKTISELLADPEDHEGKLIRIASVANTDNGDPWPAMDVEADVEITDDGGASVTILRIDQDTNIDGSPEPVWPVDVTGVFVQFDISSPYDEGYQILPRSTNDFVGGGDPLPVIANISRSLLIPEPSTDLTVTAEITDDSDVAAAEVRWQVNGGATQSAAMTGPAGSTWTGVIPGSAYVDGDLLEYWIWAEDDAPQSTESLHETVFTGTTPIADARTNDTDGAPLYDGTYARLTGVATVGNSTFSASDLDVYIQDGSGGINIFQFDGDSLVTVTVGNSYTITGEIGHFRGKSQISPDNPVTDVVDNGPATLPEPLQMSIADFLTAPETYEGQFIKIANLTPTGSGGDSWPVGGDDANIEVSDDGGTSLFTLRIDRDTDIDGSTEPTWPVAIQGVFTQFDNSAPYDEGYQIQPRSLADVDVAVGIEPVDAGIIREFKMHQNYPNPFNPNTTLQFDLPENVSQVSLVIYNTLGQKVKTLVNTALTAGSYKVSWQANAESGTKVPSGVYFAVLKTNQYQAQRIKLVLLK